MDLEECHPADAGRLAQADQQLLDAGAPVGGGDDLGRRVADRAQHRRSSGELNLFLGRCHTLPGAHVRGVPWKRDGETREKFQPLIFSAAANPATGAPPASSRCQVMAPVAKLSCRLKISTVASEASWRRSAIRAAMTPGGASSQRPWKSRPSSCATASAAA